MNFARYLLPSLFPLLCTAQEAKPDYPQDYFRNPLNIPMVLAGNFGECRPGHFHSGLDIKTQGRENLPVFAAARGYISRIKTEKGGYGHAIYITHPNGYTTVYAHLNNFIPFLQTWLRKHQYTRRRWDLDLSLSPADFPVEKGQQIAWSGNTGGSSAPHLHFEIRDADNEHPLNPQLFGLTVTDDVAPTIREVVFYDGHIYEEDALTVTLAKKGEVYKPVRTGDPHFSVAGDVVEVPAGTVGIGINVDDYMNGSDNTISFYKARLYLDDELQAEVTMDDISYGLSRYVNAYADYRAKQQHKKWIQCMFMLPGNRLNGIFTKLNKNKGRIEVGSDDKSHDLRIEVTDNNGNVSTVRMYIAANPREDVPVAPEGCKPFMQGKTNTYSDPSVSFTLDERQLYDDICFTVKATPDAAALSDRYQLHYPYVPLHHYFDLKLKPNKPIPFDLRSKVVLMYTDGKDADGKDAVAADNGWYKASVRDFGTYWLAIDTVAPFIISLQKNKANLSKAKRISFNVKETVTSVKKFSGTIDGQWVCFEQHRSSFFYEFDEHCSKGKHDLEFEVEDENGNSSKYSMEFTR